MRLVEWISVVARTISCVWVWLDDRRSPGPGGTSRVLLPGLGQKALGAFVIFLMAERERKEDWLS